MSAFTEFINKKAQETNTGGSDNVERYTPKNPVIRLGKQKDGTMKDSIIVRILPPKQDSSFEFEKPFRSTGINYTKKNGEQTYAGLTLPENQGESVLDPFITQWLNQKIPFSRFPGYPSKRFYIEVIEYYNNGGQLQPVLDEQGNVKVSPLEIPITAYNALSSQLGDETLAMGLQNAKFSFISENVAYPVAFKKVKENDRTNWYVQVYSNITLGELPSNWRDLTSDLDKLAEPTEENNPSFVNFLINKVNNTDLSTDNFTFNRDTNTLGEAPSQQSQPTQQPQQFSQPTPDVSQQSIDSQMPSNLGGAPTQQPNQQPQQTQQPQYQQQPTQQVQSQPQQNSNNPWGNFDAPDIDIPFDVPSQQQTQQQPSQPQQQVQRPQQQQTQQQTQQQPPNPPKMNQPQDIQSVLDNLDTDF